MPLLYVLDFLIGTLSDVACLIVGCFIWAIHGFAFNVEIESVWTENKMTLKGWLE